MRRLERGLLRFGKEVDRVAVKHHPSNDLDRNDFLRNDLGRVQNIEVETGRLLLVERLNAKLPFGNSPWRWPHRDRGDGSPGPRR